MSNLEITLQNIVFIIPPDAYVNSPNATACQVAISTFSE